MRTPRGSNNLDASPYTAPPSGGTPSRTGANEWERVAAWQPHDWMAKGNCTDVKDPEAFFPKRGAGTVRAKAAAGLCATCPVKQECYEYAKQYESQGIWGGVLFTRRGERGASVDDDTY